VDSYRLVALSVSGHWILVIGHFVRFAVDPVLLCLLFARLGSWFEFASKNAGRPMMNGPRIAICFLAAMVAAQVSPNTLRAQTSPPAANSDSPTAARPAIELVDLDSIERVLGQDAAQIAKACGDVWNIILVKGPDKKPL